MSLETVGYFSSAVNIIRFRLAVRTGWFFHVAELYHSGWLD
ncbi:hypothetical protein ABNN70_06565 [Sporolactobacillus sp. Y61]|uniref:Uncharacterized protein n=1 Tax=Sporolactobacillus sp. Y61 TaxID=3160863 RepID=A0AAU8IIF0_9BACL